jgi:alkylated DNA repair dioxygenase AlkB
MLNTTPDLFPEVSAKFLPLGFEYRADLIDGAQEAELVAAIETLDLAPYEFRGVKARRKVISFGFQHGYQSRRLQTASEVPSFLRDLRARAAAFAALPVDEFEQVLISEYSVGTPIGWHVDREHYDKIVGVSLLSSAILRLRRRVGDHWIRASMVLEPRSAYLLAGEARALWQHSIPAVPALRYSVTFRTMRKDRKVAAHVAETSRDW